MTGEETSQPPSRLSRQLGTFDAVMIGLGSMIGAGVFAAIGPAAAAAGGGLLIGLALAAVRGVLQRHVVRAARGALPGVGRHLRLRPRAPRPPVGLPRRVGVRHRQDRQLRGDGPHLRRLRRRPTSPARSAIGAVVALTAVNLLGVQKTAWLTRVIVAVVIGSLATVVTAGLTADPTTANIGPLTEGGVGGILQAAALLFFAFAGYARIATLGEEVRDPARTIPRAIPIALGHHPRRLRHRRGHRARWRSGPTPSPPAPPR